MLPVSPGNQIYKVASFSRLLVLLGYQTYMFTSFREAALLKKSAKELTLSREAPPVSASDSFGVKAT